MTPKVKTATSRCGGFGCGTHRIGEVACSPVVAVELAENPPTRIKHDGAQVVRDGTVFAPEHQIHFRREHCQRVGRSDGEEPVVRVAAAIKISVSRSEENTSELQ